VKNPVPFSGILKKIRQGHQKKFLKKSGNICKQMKGYFFLFNLEEVNNRKASPEQEISSSFRI
jgi:hypothetical protein